MSSASSSSAEEEEFEKRASSPRTGSTPAELVSLRDIKVGFYKKLITVRGCIIRVNRSCHMARLLVLACKKCKDLQAVELRNGVYEAASRKRCNACRSQKFLPALGSPAMETVPVQVVRVQEHFGEEADEQMQGRVPRVMDVELQAELVDSCQPGDDVSVTGRVKMNGADNGAPSVRVSVVNPLYIEAASVSSNKAKSSGASGTLVEFTPADYRAINAIHASPDPLGLLVGSVCPGILGHEVLKAALLLSLLGGSPKHAALRDNVHVLLVGDPGLGKSQMLQACSRIAPKGIYVSGNASTSSGLTATLVREAGQNDFALEPGALVLADRGCCCIDEFDKMPTQHQALLEAMEQQSVSVAKSGVIWSLPSRTSILAAANPIGGRYDKSKTLSRNLNMSQPLLSRFDLIFLLLDQPDKDLDNFMSGHVMLMHTGNDGFKGEDVTAYQNDSNQSGSFKKRLITARRKLGKTVPPSVLRKYISYARQYVKPTLSAASAAVLQKYYLGLRKKTNSAAVIPPCTRQLEALIRLTEARAKLDLREETTEEDALEVVELMQYSVLGMVEEKLNCDMITSGRKTSRNCIKAFLELLTRDSEERDNNMYSKSELKNLAAKGGISNRDVLDAIDKFNEQGYLIKKGINLYEFKKRR